MGVAHPPDTNKIFIVSGWRAAGKTPFCQSMIDQAHTSGMTVSGILSPGRFADNRKDGFFVRDLASGETRLLASLIPGELEGIRLGPWTFDRSVMDWGNQCLLESGKTDLLVVDEIGPLEFEKHLGWTASFEVLERRLYRAALVVIRPECLDAFSVLGYPYQKIEITPEMNQGPAAGEILAAMTDPAN